MSSIDQLQKPIQAEMKSFETHFKGSMKSAVPLLDTITQYIIKRKGKQMRPMFVFLTAQVTGEVNPATYRAATLIELLHTATLVHDDVVDDSNRRRGFFSINALWKNKIAVLVGDYLLSKGLLLSVQHKDFHLLEIVSNAVKEMSEGELLQIEKARKLDITEDVYFQIIRQKTASLIASCCACGAASVTQDATTIEQMRLFGENVGIAFQLKDDLFDYGQYHHIGKPSGIDIKEKKMTLPLIYALQKATRSQKREIIYIIKNQSDNVHQVKKVMDFVLQSGGVEYAQQQMESYKQRALELIERFAEGPAKTSLIGLVNFTTERKN